MLKPNPFRAAIVLASLVLVGTSTRSVAEPKQPEAWGDYLDFAYVYTSADPEPLQKRLSEYTEATGISLDEYIENFLRDPLLPDAPIDESMLRRTAIAHLLQYLASR
ncbi:MAG: hypothetical protein GY944_27055, partial [bacterium]|nr:hypothetical protein [bacterium]